MREIGESETNDNNTTIEDLKTRIRAFVKKRKWEKYHTPKNVSESICIEAAELLQIFQWTDQNDWSPSSSPERIVRVSEELADVIIYCISMANTMKIDIANAVLTKLKINERKYPAETWEGKAYLK